MDALVEAGRSMGPVYAVLSKAGSRESARTRASVVRKVATMMRVDVERVAHFRRPQMLELRARLVAEALAPATCAKILSTMKSVLRESWRAGEMSRDDYEAAVDIDPIKGSRLPSGRALQIEELRTLAQATEGPLGVRDRALLFVLAFAGLRRDEAACIQRSDVDLSSGTLDIRHGKGNRQRKMPLPSQAIAALAAWLEVCPTEKLFPTKDRIYQICQAMAERSGVANFSPHDLRRTYITTLLDRGADLVTTSKLAGHARVETTAIYDRRGEAAKRAAVELICESF